MSAVFSYGRVYIVSFVLHVSFVNLRAAITTRVLDGRMLMMIFAHNTTQLGVQEAIRYDVLFRERFRA